MGEKDAPPITVAVAATGPGKPRALRRWGVLTAAVIGAALGLAACAGSSGPGVASDGSTTTQPGSSNGTASPGSQLLAYSHCMRSHGVSDFPDPSSTGVLPKLQTSIAASNPRYQSAQQACRRLLPGRTLQERGNECMQDNDCAPSLVQQMVNADRKLAGCMRSHGAPNFPDPTNGGSGGPWFDISKVGISDAASHTHKFIAELNECGRLIDEWAPESFG